MNDFSTIYSLEISFNARYPEPGKSGKVHHHYRSGKEIGQKKKERRKKILPGLHLIIPLLVESDEFTALSPSHCSYKSPDHLPFHSRLS